METKILFPKVGFSMQEGVLTEWLVQDGSVVEKGQPLFVLESDKSSQEVESSEAGTIKIIAPSGETYKVGDVLGTIES